MVFNKISSISKLPFLEKYWSISNKEDKTITRITNKNGFFGLNFESGYKIPKGIYNKILPNILYIIICIPISDPWDQSKYLFISFKKEILYEYESLFIVLPRLSEKKRIYIRKIMYIRKNKRLKNISRFELFCLNIIHPRMKYRFCL